MYKPPTMELICAYTLTNGRGVNRLFENPEAWSTSSFPKLEVTPRRWISVTVHLQLHLGRISRPGNVRWHELLPAPPPRVLYAKAPMFVSRYMGKEPRSAPVVVKALIQSTVRISTSPSSMFKFRANPNTIDRIWQTCLKPVLLYIYCLLISCIS